MCVLYHFQVDNMEARLFLLYVICQTIITKSLGGTLPFPDFVGKVTPIKPKPLSSSTFSSTGTPSICNTKDVLPKLLSSASGGTAFREFSSPLTFTSSSRALPVPKIDSLSIADVKLPERLREKLLSRKLGDASFRKSKPDICSPEVSTPYKYPCLSFPSKLANALPTYTLSDMCPTSFNKLSSLSSMKSLPIVPVEALKSNTVPLTSKSPLTFEARQPLLSEPLYPSSSSCSLPFPLYYKSMYLPGVRTPSDMLPLNYKPISSTDNRNLNPPCQFYPQNLANSVSERNTLSALPYLNPITSSEISKSQNMIQVPKPSSNIPFSMNPGFCTQNPAVQNLWSPLESNSGYTSVSFKSRLEPCKSLLSSSDLKNDKDLKLLLSSLSCTLIDKISDFTHKTSNSPKMSSEIGVATPLKDCSRKLNIPNLYPDRIHFNDARIAFDSIPSLRQINAPKIFSNPSLPTRASTQYPLLPDKCISNVLKYSPPVIPREPIPTISSVSSDFSPLTYCPSKISQPPITPSISYINQSPSTSIAQSTSKMVSSINDVVSNIAQNILYSYKSQITSAPQNTSQRLSFTPKSNPYAEAVLKPAQTPSVVLTLPQVDLVNAQSILPIITPSININPPAVLLDTPCISSAFEISSSQPLAATVVPLSSLITFSSPQLCPSYLPSPTLPSYPSIASPFYMEAPVFKVSSMKKDSDVEKLIELMLIAEILNNDESFDWDDLDTLLAFLSLS